jgi:predicted RNA methylase
MAGPFPKFPMLVYHSGQDDRRVNSEEDLVKAIEEGFSETPTTMTEEGRLKARIEWHEGEIKRIKKELAEIRTRKAA